MLFCSLKNVEGSIIYHFYYIFRDECTTNASITMQIKTNLKGSQHKIEKHFVARYYWPKAVITDNACQSQYRTSG